MSDLLVELARKAAQKAHAPYSGYSVGCAIESVDGEVVVGANMENACYRLGVCAEISALTAAQQAFGLANIARVAVSGGRFVEGRLTGPDICRPCGGCRQAIYEAFCLAGRDIAVISSCADGDRLVVESIRDLLPDAFGPANL
jgi:cytidine deaminase